jgi:hypothetical protein
MKVSLVKTLLHHIFRILSVVRYPIRHRQDSPFVTHSQFLESVHFSALGGRYQRGIRIFVDTACTKRFHGCVPPTCFPNSALTTFISRELELQPFRKVSLPLSFIVSLLLLLLSSLFAAKSLLEALP